jgi:TonB family protein
MNRLHREVSLNRLAGRVLFALLVINVWFPVNAKALSAQEQSSAPSPKVIRKVGNQLQSDAMTRVEPLYPPVAKAAAVRGSVVVEVIVNEEGIVISAIARSGHALLWNAATTAARGWKFKPAQVNGTAVTVTGTIMMKFDLEGNAPIFSNAKAEIEMAKALAGTYPDSPERHFWLGGLYVREKQLEEAIGAYKKAIELKPDYQEAYLSLGPAYRAAKNVEAELNTYKQAAEAIPNSIESLRMLAWAWANASGADKAVKVLKRIISINPNDFGAYNSLGWYYMGLRHYEDAVPALLQAIQIKPDAAIAYHNLGWAYSLQERYQEAIEAYTKALQVEPTYSQLYKVHRELGDVYLKLNRHSEAKEAFDQAVKLNPDDGFAYFGLARLLWAQKKNSEADAMYLLGEAIMREASFERALQTEPNNPEALHKLGRSLVERNARLPEALNMLQQAVRAEPKNPGYLASLGWAYFKLERLEEAERYLDQAIQLNDKSATFYEQLGDVYDRRGKNELARTAWQKALSLAVGSEHTARLKTKVRQIDPKAEQVLRQFSDYTSRGLR